MNDSECWRIAYGFIAAGETGRAIDVCESQACSGVLECQRFLGWTYYQRNDFDRALYWFGKGASKNDGDATFGVGSVHFVQRRFQPALEHFERAAATGYSRALHWIAYIYHQGLGVPKNLELAADYYEQSAAQGNLIARRALLHMAWQRRGVFGRLLMLPGFASLLLRTFVIAGRDLSDPRIADVPNAFQRKSN